MSLGGRKVPLPLPPKGGREEGQLWLELLESPESLDLFESLGFLEQFKLFESLRFLEQFKLFESFGFLE